MAGEPEIHVDLVLRPADRTVTGEVGPEGGPTEPYAGWIGLLAALQELAAGGPDSTRRQSR